MNKSITIQLIVFLVLATILGIMVYWVRNMGQVSLSSAESMGKILYKYSICQRDKCLYVDNFVVIEGCAIEIIGDNKPTQQVVCGEFIAERNK